MIKGWKNNPQWVEYYKKRDEGRIIAQMERWKLESYIRCQKVESEWLRIIQNQEKLKDDLP